MQFLEPQYETTGLLDLPPLARDIALEWLSSKNLTELLSIQAENTPDTALLSQHKTSAELWPKIISATLLAKVTSFTPSESYQPAEVLYLLKIACSNAGYSLSIYTLSDVIELIGSDMPNLKNWLMEFAALLRAQKKPQ